eukprot:GHVO01058094.1.p1 GENE.GHVO01058094.1~~GHVO01058094.1.p1  ORF type:complete len:276 (+),score=39.16 GHVO01058094.1:44-871(+)
MIKKGEEGEAHTTNYMEKQIVQTPVRRLFANWYNEVFSKRNKNIDTLDTLDLVINETFDEAVENIRNNHEDCDTNLEEAVEYIKEKYDVLFEERYIMSTLAEYGGTDNSMHALGNAGMDWLKGKRDVLYQKTAVLMCALKALNNDHINGYLRYVEYTYAWKELWRQRGVDNEDPKDMRKSAVDMHFKYIEMFAEMTIMMPLAIKEAEVEKKTVVDASLKALCGTVCPDLADWILCERRTHAPPGVDSNDTWKFNAVRLLRVVLSEMYPDVTQATR